MKTLEQRIEIAKKRLVDMEEMRDRFVDKYIETRDKLYKDMVKDLNNDIEKLRVIIGEALIQR